MSLYLVIVAAIGVGLFARFVKNRSAIFWTLGTFAAILIGDIPIRAILAANPAANPADAVAPPIAVTLTVITIVGGVMLLLAMGARKLEPEQKDREPASKPTTPASPGN